MFDPKELDTHRNQRFIKNKVNGSKIFKLSDRTKNKEGRNIDFAIVDEVHEMKDNVIMKSIEQSQSLKENPKLIVITTEGFVNDGVLDDLLVQARRIIAGEDDSISAERFLPWLYTQDSEQEVWTDEKSWLKSNPTLGIVKKWDYLREQVDLARKNKADRMFVLSKDFNFKQSNSQAWLMTEDYSYEAVFDVEKFRGSLCLGAVDLAQTTDLVSARIMLMREGDSTKYVYQHYWIPELKLQNSDDKSAGAKYSEWAKNGMMTICEGNDVDLTQVADWFYHLHRDYGLRLYKCGYDVKFSKDFLKRMDEYGFECEMVLQNKLTLSNAMKLVEADFKARRINYNQNDVDMWCLGNASMEIDDLGNVMCVKINNQHAKRIDGAVTFIILWEIYRRYRSDFTRNLLCIEHTQNECER
jgi:phage terminase large subunit-like protein